MASSPKADINDILYYAAADRPKAFRSAVKNILTLAGEFAKTYNIQISLEEAVLIDVVRLYSRDIDKMVCLDKVSPNAYRQASALCIWLVRLKPIVGSSFVEHRKASKDRIRQAKSQINEMFAMFAAFSVILADHLNTGERAGMVDLVKGLQSPAYDDLLSVLRYRVVSRHAIALLLQTMCEGGLRTP